MITGVVLFVAGILTTLLGSFRFNLGQVATGWVIAGAGVAVFLSHLVWVP
jgi:hypothetical protein